MLLDDGEHTSPTKENIMNAYKTLVAEAAPGDACFCHYSGKSINSLEPEFSILPPTRLIVLNCIVLVQVTVVKCAMMMETRVSAAAQLSESAHRTSKTGF